MIHPVLLNAWKESDSVLDKLLQEYAGQLTDLRAGLERELNTLRRDDGRIPTLNFNNEWLNRLIHRAGWRSYTKAAELVINSPRVSELAITSHLSLENLQPSRRAVLTALNYTSTELESVRAGIRGRILPLIQEMVFSNVSPKEVSQAVSTLTGSTKKRAETTVLTALSGLQRDIQTQVAEALPKGDERFWYYIGPEDHKNRKFCEKLVGYCVRESDLSLLRNGQNLPVRRFCGGYRCRHTWLILTTSMVEALNIRILSREDIRRVNIAA